MASRSREDRFIHFLVAALALVDFSLAAVAFVAPDLWLGFFHDPSLLERGLFDAETAADPYGLLARSAGGWLAFGLVQLFVWFRWRGRPELLLLVAGVRLGDALTDAAYVLAADPLTPWGGVALALAGPANIVLGVYLYRVATRRG